MFYDLRDENVVFLFGILFIEDTVLFVLESYTSETILNIPYAIITIEEITDIIVTFETEINILSISSYRDRSISTFYIISIIKHIHAIFRIIEKITVPYIFSIS